MDQLEKSYKIVWTKVKKLWHWT